MGGVLVLLAYSSFGAVAVGAGSCNCDQALENALAARNVSDGSSTAHRVDDGGGPAGGEGAASVGATQPTVVGPGHNSSGSGSSSSGGGAVPADVLGLASVSGWKEVETQVRVRCYM